MVRAHFDARIALGGWPGDDLRWRPISLSGNRPQQRMQSAALPDLVVALRPAPERSGSFGRLVRSGRVPWSGGNEGVVVMLSDGVRAGR